MFRRSTSAVVISLVALFFSLSGAAFAGGYLLNSTSQISPSVYKALKGAQGKRGFKGAKGAKGAKGVPGVTGAAGAAGATGPAGPFPDALPSGKTVSGTWAVAGSGTATPGEDAITYDWPLAARPTPNIVPQGGPVPAGCSGTIEHPVANPGNVCIFVGWMSNTAPANFGDYDPTTANGQNSQSAFTGIVVYTTGSAAGTFEAGGTWAVTAP